jgi:hypothetical protein
LESFQAGRNEKQLTLLSLLALLAHHIKCLDEYPASRFATVVANDATLLHYQAVARQLLALFPCNAMQTQVAEIRCEDCSMSDY